MGYSTNENLDHSTLCDYVLESNCYLSNVFETIISDMMSECLVYLYALCKYNEISEQLYNIGNVFNQWVFKKSYIYIYIVINNDMKDK